MNIIKLSSLVFLGLLVANCKNKQQEVETQDPTPQEQTTPLAAFHVDFEKLSNKYISTKSKEVEEFYTSHIKKNGYTGSFLVAKNGEVLFEDYSGLADKRNNIPITQDTPIHVASVGKVVTAVAVLRLVEQNKLSLDQSVADFFKDFPFPEITVKMLLNHRSGLKYYGYFQNIWDTSKSVTNKDVIEVLVDNKVPLDFTPDTRFSYSNTNYLVLASIVEKVTQSNFNKALQELIFTPLSMDNSFVLNDLDQKLNVTQSYKSNYSPMHWDYMDGTYGDKNIYTTPRDFLKLDTAMYNDDFLSKQTKDMMFVGYSYENKGKRNYGLGFRIIELDNGKNYTYHNGWWRGNTSSYIRLSDEQTCIILFSNKYSKSTYKTVDLAHHFGNYDVGNTEV